MSEAVDLQRFSFGAMAWRAVRLRCPRCASRHTFLRGWFRRYDRCRTCRISWRREEGFELGAVTVNTIVTFGILTMAMLIGLISTAPDIPVVGLVLALCAVAIVVPIVIYPFTYTLWLAFDLAVHPPSNEELTQAEPSASPPSVVSRPQTS